MLEVVFEMTSLGHLLISPDDSDTVGDEELGKKTVGGCDGLELVEHRPIEEPGEYMERLHRRLRN